MEVAGAQRGRDVPPLVRSKQSHSDAVTHLQCRPGAAMGPTLERTLTWESVLCICIRMVETGLGHNVFARAWLVPWEPRKRRLRVWMRHTDSVTPRLLIRSAGGSPPRASQPRCDLPARGLYLTQRSSFRGWQVSLRRAEHSQSGVGRSMASVGGSRL